MSRRHISIDLGPLALPFFSESNLTESSFGKASKDDIEKFHNLLRDGENEKKKSVNLDDQNFSDIGIKDIESEIKAGEKLIELAKATSAAASSINGEDEKLILVTAEIKIRESLLPDTTITAKKINNDIFFELCIGDESHRNWLVKKLPVLAKEIGERINCQIQISVLDSKNRDSVIATQRWPDVEQC